MNSKPPSGITLTSGYALWKRASFSVDMLGGASLWPMGRKDLTPLYDDVTFGEILKRAVDELRKDLVLGDPKGLPQISERVIAAVNDLGRAIVRNGDVRSRLGFIAVLLFVRLHSIAPRMRREDEKRG